MQKKTLLSLGLSLILILLMTGQALALDINTQQDLIDLGKNGGNGTLKQTIGINTTITVEKDVNLDLNNHLLDGELAGNLFVLQNGAGMNIKNGTVNMKATGPTPTPIFYVGGGSNTTHKAWLTIINCTVNGENAPAVFNATKNRLAITDSTLQMKVTKNSDYTVINEGQIAVISNSTITGGERALLNVLDSKTSAGATIDKISASTIAGLENLDGISLIENSTISDLYNKGKITAINKSTLDSGNNLNLITAIKDSKLTGAAYSLTNSGTIDSIKNTTADNTIMNTATGKINLIEQLNLTAATAIGLKNEGIITTLTGSTLLAGKALENTGTITTISKDTVLTNQIVKVPPTIHESNQPGIPYYSEGNKKVWLGFSAVLNGKNRYILPANSGKILFGENPVTFSDIPEKFWGKQAIDFVASRQLFAGVTTPGGSNNQAEFQPDAPMTRAMCGVMLARLMQADLSTVTKTPFTDVNMDSWYGPSIAWATQNNYLNGTGATTFEPNKNITRQELAVLLSNCATLQNIAFTGNKAINFKDEDQIASWAKTAMNQMAQAQIINGYEDNSCQPQQQATRAEVATMMMHFIQYCLH